MDHFLAHTDAFLFASHFDMCALLNHDVDMRQFTLISLELKLMLQEMVKRRKAKMIMLTNQNQRTDVIDPNS